MECFFGHLPSLPVRRALLTSVLLVSTSVFFESVLLVPAHCQLIMQSNYSFMAFNYSEKPALDKHRKSFEIILLI